MCKKAMNKSRNHAAHKQVQIRRLMSKSGQKARETQLLTKTCFFSQAHWTQVQLMLLVTLLLAPEERSTEQNQDKLQRKLKNYLIKYLSFHNHLVTKSFNNQTAFFVTKQRKCSTVTLRFKNQDIYVDLF